MTAQEEKSDSTTKKASKPKLGQPSASEESASPYPNMELCQQIHKLLVKADGTEDGKLQIQVLNRIREELENPALYESVESSLGVTTGLWSAEDLAAQKVNNQKTVKDLEKKVEDAKESAGDMEVMDARVEYARFAAKSLTEEEALVAYKMLLELPKVSSGKKIDAVMESSRVASFYGNSKKASESIDNAQKMATEGGGGDWDRRNRLKVYRGLQRLLERDIKGAAALLIDCIATFSCNEICSYQDFIVYSIMSNLLHLPRPQIKAKILDGPEILSVAGDIPVVVSP